MTKPIRFTKHARERLASRGATEEKVKQAIREGAKERAKDNREMRRMNFAYNDFWQGSFYAIKQVAPVIVEEEREIVVITVYAYYF